jgi:hypothetical protein
MAETLRDRARSTFVVSVSGAVKPSPGDWTVVVDAGVPVSAIAPGERAAVTEIVVADADMPVDLALAAPALRDLEPGSAVVCVSEGDVVGLWAGEDLDDALMLGPARLAGDTRLAGTIQIPLVSRRCRFEEGGVPCGGRLSVPEKPESMPPCRNPAPLTAHNFVW